MKKKVCIIVIFKTIMKNAYHCCCFEFGRLLHARVSKLSFSKKNIIP